MRKVLVAFFVVFLVLVVILTIRGQREGVVTVNPLNGKSECLTHSDILQPEVVPTGNLSFELLEEMKNTFSEIAVAYSNRQVSVMRDDFAKVSNVVCSLRPREYEYVVGPTYRIFRAEFFCKDNVDSHKRSLPEFASVKDFEKYSGCVVEMSRILGEIECSRKGGAGIDTYDALPLCHFKMFRDRFRQEKQGDFLSCVDGVIAHLIERVESKEGFAYRHMQKVYEDNIKLVNSGDLSREDMTKVIRFRGAYWILDVAGYEPKWLNDFK